ncbi:MAG: YbhB/YbcL family Raf kinase inhibitor-like protein, partial [Proteobacteria bacterium]|nr:YbhB/YbcL family Raf kinase inhibitor-like protein [Pseudomonadota bacterium]
PKKTWVHWVLYNLPIESSGLPEAVSTLPTGTQEGVNDWQRTGYGGPCPPIGQHRYFFKLYALDAVLPDLKQPTKEQLEAAMQDHILEEDQLVGVYQR